MGKSITVNDIKKLEMALNSAGEYDHIKIVIPYPHDVIIKDSKLSKGVTAVGNSNITVSGSSRLNVFGKWREPESSHIPIITALDSSYVESSSNVTVIAKDQSCVYSYMGCTATIILEKDAILSTSGSGTIRATGNSRIIARKHCAAHIDIDHNSKVWAFGNEPGLYIDAHGSATVYVTRAAASKIRLYDQAKMLIIDAKEISV